MHLFYYNNTIVITDKEVQGDDQAKSLSSSNVHILRANIYQLEYSF